MMANIQVANLVVLDQINQLAVDDQRTIQGGDYIWLITEPRGTSYGEVSTNSYYGYDTVIRGYKHEPNQVVGYLFGGVFVPFYGRDE